MPNFSLALNCVCKFVLGGTVSRLSDRKGDEPGVCRVVAQAQNQQCFHSPSSFASLLLSSSSDCSPLKFFHQELVGPTRRRRQG